MAHIFGQILQLIRAHNTHSMEPPYQNRHIQETSLLRASIQETSLLRASIAGPYVYYLTSTLRNLCIKNKSSGP